MQMLLRQNAFESARPEQFRPGFFYSLSDILKI